jgi:hypothetical protein
MNKLLLLLVFWLSGAILVSGQTSADLSKKYQPLSAYQVRPEIVMTAKYAPDGQVCEVVLEPRRVQGTKMVFGDHLSRDTVEQLVDELVSEAERGKRLPKAADTIVDGDFMITEHLYENISVEIDGVTRPKARYEVAVVTWLKRKCADGQTSSQSKQEELRQPRPQSAAPDAKPKAVVKTSARDSESMGC